MRDGTGRWKQAIRRVRKVVGHLPGRARHTSRDPSCFRRFGAWRRRIAVVPLAHLLAGAVALGGCVAIEGGAFPAAARTGADDRATTIFVVARKWHTDLGLPAAELSSPALAPLRETFPGARYFLFGFGERTYFTSPNPSVGEAVLALLVPGPGAVLVTGLRVPPTEAFGATQAVPLPVSRAGIDRLEAFLARSLGADEEGGDAPRRIGDGPYPGSVFYAAATTYSALYTCNTWTAEGLALAGTGVRAEGVLFASQVMEQAHRRAAFGEQPRDGTSTAEALPSGAIASLGRGGRRRTRRPAAARQRRRLRRAHRSQQPATKSAWRRTKPTLPGSARRDDHRRRWRRWVAAAEADAASQADRGQEHEKQGAHGIHPRGQALMGRGHCYAGGGRWFREPLHPAPHSTTPRSATTPECRARHASRALGAAPAVCVPSPATP